MVWCLCLPSVSVEYYISKEYTLHDQPQCHFLKIYDGPSEQSTQIEKLSGNLGSFYISSTENFLFAKFESDDTADFQVGFHATIYYSK